MENQNQLYKLQLYKLLFQFNNLNYYLYIKMEFYCKKKDKAMNRDHKNFKCL